MGRSFFHLVSRLIRLRNFSVTRSMTSDAWLRERPIRNTRLFKVIHWTSSLNFPSRKWNAWSRTLRRRPAVSIPFQRGSSRNSFTTWLHSSFASSNRSLLQGQFPENFRIAEVTPILKKSTLDPSVLSSYRPISNLQFISKATQTGRQRAVASPSPFERSPSGTSICISTQPFHRDRPLEGKLRRPDRSWHG